LAATDVKEMFFVVPLQPKDQAHFAFTWEGQEFTFTRLPRGLKHSPALAHRALARELELILPEKEVKIHQYTDGVFMEGEASRVGRQSTGHNHETPRRARSADSTGKGTLFCR